MSKRVPVYLSVEEMLVIEESLLANRYSLKDPKAVIKNRLENLLEEEIERNTEPSDKGVGMPLSEFEQKQYDEKGVKKPALKDGAYYKGSCRNAQVAIWHAATNQFYYIRTKWGSSYVESLPGPEDSIDGMDYFLPMEELAEAPFEIKPEDDCRGMRRWDGQNG